MYAWSNDNDTETELTPAELTQYEYASSVKPDATTNITELNHPPMMDLSHFQSVIDDAQTAAQTAHKDSDGTSTIGRKDQESSEAHLSPHTATESSVESYGSDLVRIMAAADVPGLGQPTSPISPSSSSPTMETSPVVESPRSSTNLITVSETANPAQSASQQVRISHGWISSRFCCSRFNQLSVRMRTAAITDDLSTISFLISIAVHISTLSAAVGRFC